MPQISLYINAGDPLLGKLSAAAAELGCSMNEIAYDLVAEHLEGYVALALYLRRLRATESERLRLEAKAREQAELDARIRQPGIGLDQLYSRAWITAHELILDTSNLGPPESYGSPALDGRLAPLLATTGGHLLLQEQFGEICVDIGGFSPEDAQAARKVAAKKQADKVAAFGRRFVDGAVNLGIDARSASAFWERLIYGTPTTDPGWGYSPITTLG